MLNKLGVKNSIGPDFNVTIMLLLLALLYVGLPVLSANSQVPFELDRSRLSPAAAYNFTDPGDITIKVHAWGALRFAGLYEIPRGTKLSELISLAGGPQFGVRTRRTKRRIDLKLTRLQEGMRMVVWSVSMENEITITDDDPELMDGDILSMEGVQRAQFSVRDLFPIIGAAASLTIVIDRLTDRN